MRTSKFWYGTLVAAAVATLWGVLGGPLAAPPAPASLGGLSFSPLGRGQDPAQRPLPTRAELDADLALVAEHTQRIRTYSVDGSFDEIPPLAKRHGLSVTAGIWLDAPTSRAAAAANDERMRALAELVADNDNIERVIIGNETLLSGALPLAELAALLDDARATLDVPVGTAEPWNVWMANPELAAHVDFIAVHFLPYWEGIHVDSAVDHVAARLDDLRALFADQPIVIGEVGWPSFGRARGDATATLRNAAVFARRFLAHAEHQGYDYFFLEAFDQPWKRVGEGDAGAYWGIYDVDRALKLDLWGDVDSIPHRHALALLSIVLALAVLALLLADARRLRGTGRAFLALTASVVTPLVVLSLSAYAEQYWTPFGLLSAGVLFAGMLGVLALLLVDAHEWAEAQWNRHRLRPVPQLATCARAPKVSVHVPAHAEPPEMVVETLHALAALDYPHLEVIVVDNNTADEQLWRPIEACCAELGDHFRFFHVAPLAGYKAGALNFALRHTAPDAEIVAVIDSDYRVDPKWLEALVPHFADDDVAIVQAPQAYRDGAVSAFKGTCDLEYRGFFAIGMVTRANRNAIIQHGTMTMIDKRVLEEVGGWAEWTVTEDAELGLRVLEHGYEAVYTTQCYGRGLTPDNFGDYKAQRYRWALGAMQILRRHGRKLLGLAPSKLSLGQRFHFLTGWLAWLGDGMNLVFNLVAVAWSACMIAAPLEFFAPLATFSAFVLALFAFKLVKMIVLYRARVGTGVVETLAAVVAGLALVHVVGRAVLAGIYSKRARFFRTPKLGRRHSLRGALVASGAEIALSVALLASAAGVIMTAPYASIDRTLWCALLGTMAIPHLAAVGVALLSALGARARSEERERNARSAARSALVGAGSAEHVR